VCGWSRGRRGKGPCGGEGSPVIQSPEEAAAASERLHDAEAAFVANADPTVRLPLAREILRLRTALNDYRVRVEVRTVRERRERERA
jgi:hypothetical protein